MRGANGIPTFVNKILTNPTQVFGADDALAIVRGKSANAAAGSSHHYSNTHDTLPGKLIEHTTLQTLAAVFGQRIFEPSAPGTPARLAKTHITARIGANNTMVEIAMLDGVKISRTAILDFYGSLLI